MMSFLLPILPEISYFNSQRGNSHPSLIRWYPDGTWLSSLVKRWRARVEELSQACDLGSKPGDRHYVRSFKNLFRKWRAKESVTVLVKMAMATLRENPVIATPKAVPLAGGCSVSELTIKNIEIATASEYMIIEERSEGCGINADNEPERRPTRCPPNYPPWFSCDVRGHSKYDKSCCTY